MYTSATGIKTGKMRAADVSRKLNSELLNEQGPQWKKVVLILTFSIGSSSKYSRALANITSRKSSSPIIWVPRLFYRFHSVYSKMALLCPLPISTKWKWPNDLHLHAWNVVHICIKLDLQKVSWCYDLNWRGSPLFYFGFSIFVYYLWFPGGSLK